MLPRVRAHVPGPPRSCSRGLRSDRAGLGASVVKGTSFWGDLIRGTSPLPGVRHPSRDHPTCTSSSHAASIGVVVHLFIYLAVLGLSCGMWDLVP